MSLQRLLEIDGRFLKEHQNKALRLAESVWEGLGSPTERRALIKALERILMRCQGEGLEYPPVLLKRKKELERRDWMPRSAPAPATTPQATHPSIPAEWIRQAEERERKGG